MTPIIEKYFNPKVIQSIAQKHNYDKETFGEFINFLDLFLSDLEKDNALEDGEPIDNILEISEKYINYYSLRRKEGFSVTWSKKYAEKQCDFDTRNLLMHCYKASEEEDKEQAHNDIMIYCKLTERNQFFIDYLLLRIRNGDVFGEKSIEKVVEEFVAIYDEQRANGKSELYAYQYATYYVDNYHHIFCEDYAFIYEESINNGKTKEYANQYAYNYASELVDIKRRYGMSEDEESLSYAKLKAKAYINGWEYAKSNNLKHIARFIEFYMDIFLNTFNPNNPKDLKSIEECKIISSQKAMEMYEKIND